MTLVVDYDDVWPGNDGMDLLRRLKEANQAFKVTLFAAPGRADDAYWDSFPAWVELAVHGYLHPDPYECSEWSYERTQEAIDRKPARFVAGWRSPGWQSSRELLECMRDNGWWVADHYEGNATRPKGLLTHVLDSGDHLHGHIGWNGSGNDLSANFQGMKARVIRAREFAFISEVVEPWA